MDWHSKDKRCLAVESGHWATVRVAMVFLEGESGYLARC